MPRSTSMRHPALANVVASGLFDEDGADFVGFEATLSSLSSAGAPTKAIGDAFEVFAEAFLRTEPTVGASEVWPSGTIPSEILGELKLPQGDMGCDGVYRTADGRLVAYQVKFRSARGTLTWRDVSTFLSVADEAAARLVLTNCDGVADPFRDRRDVLSVLGGDLASLGADRMAEIKSMVRGTPLARELRSPLPHQEEAITDIVRGLEVEDRVTALMACGTGKTLTALWTAHRLGCRRILVLLPSLALLRQTLVDWAREQQWGDGFRFMCVCSDQTVVRGDDVALHQADVPFPITTDAEDIWRFLKRADDAATTVVFSTYHSGERVADGMPQGFCFDFGIFDEAHRTTGHSGSAFGIALKDEAIRIRKRLFMTATKRVYSADAKGRTKLLQSMDDETTYGPVVHNLTFKAAAELGIICRYKILVSVVTRSLLPSDEELRQALVDGNPMSLPDIAGQVALARAVEDYGAKKVFTFHATVRDAARFAAPSGVVRALGEPFQVFHVSGAMPSSHRERILGDFRGADLACVTNAKCLTEGVDVPAVDMVAFMSRKESKIDIVQAVGRALRRPRDGNKKFGYVLIPVFLDEEAGETVEAAVQRANLQGLWEVIRALMDQDGELEDVVDRLRASMKLNNRFDGAGLEDFVDFIGPPMCLDDLRRSVGIRLVDRLGATVLGDAPEATEDVTQAQVIASLERRFVTRLSAVPSASGAFRSEDGRMHFQLSHSSRPQAESKRHIRFNKVGKTYLDHGRELGWFVIWSNWTRRGWCIPMEPLGEFLLSLQHTANDHIARWNFNTHERPSHDWIHLRGKKFDVTPFRFGA